MGTTSVDASTPLHERVVALADQLSASERLVAQYMSQNPDAVAVSSATEMASATGTSDATVVRTAKALGYPGLRELKRSAIETLTRRRNPASVLDDRLGRFEHDGFDRVITDSADLVHELRRTVDGQSWAEAVDTVSAARRVFAYGIGPAGALADHLAITLTRIGVEAHPMTSTGFRLADGLLAMTSADVAFVFAPLRLFREIETVIDHAHTVGARVIVVTEALGLSLTGKADVVLSTPQSTTNAASETMCGLLLSHALGLAVAARNREHAVQTMELLNQLRADVVGAQLDAHPLQAPGRTHATDPGNR